ncbi:MAG: ABC transporter permease [Dehalococcoidia bacterium]|nr:ABC transporter permease [Dehalococcoidia bacterium]
MLTFFGQQLMPGDPLFAILGVDPSENEDFAANPEMLEELRSRYGLDQPMIVQYANYVGRLAQGDLGTSLRSKRPIIDMLKERLPITLTLSLATYFTNVFIGIALGVVAALRPGKVDFFATSYAVFGAATPNFWAAILMIVVFSVWLGWLPTSGWVAPWDDFGRSLKYLALPILANGFFGSAIIMRQTRSGLMEVLRQDYIVTARAKGLATRTVIMRHALKNAMLPAWTVIGLSLSTLISGSVLIERVFGIPGIGRLAVDAAQTQDFPVIQAIVIISTMAIVLANLVTDIVYGYLDPRIRVS